jgi:parallel beta-helix repeat protein
VTVHSYVQNVQIVGMAINGFPGSGIDQIGGSGSTFIGNRATNNGGYGIVAFVSTGTRELYNFASGSGEAGLYIGDSPQANAKLIANTAVNNMFGIFVRDAEHGEITANNVHDNCLGVLFLADAPGPAGAFTLTANLISHNNNSCPGGPEAGPPLSGIGVLINGAHDVVIHENAIFNNVASGPTIASAGVGVTTGNGGTPPTNNRVQGNLILKNTVDIIWDGNGTGNVLKPNWCQTSSPAGICH